MAMAISSFFPLVTSLFAAKVLLIKISPVKLSLLLHGWITKQLHFRVFFPI
jgi:hypothetical protein